MKNKKIILISFIIVLLIGIATLCYFQVFKSENNSQSTITYSEGSYDDDFSDCKEIVVDLSKVDSKYKITKRGIYRLKNSLKGYIEINSKENVKIILDNATITNNNGPAIYIVNGDTYIETIGEATLTDGDSYTNFDNIDAVIYSKDNLIFTGSGTLNINAKYKDGIASTDNVIIKAGNYVINSNDDGVRGKDSVVIYEGNFDIISTGDGIKTTNTKDSKKGYILIKNGTFKIVSDTDALQATTNIEIDDGDFNITTGGSSANSSVKSDWGRWGKSTNNEEKTSSKGIKAGNNILIKNIELKADTSDDAIHSNNKVTINNGNIEISSGDDGIHADKKVYIKNGSINITKSYEGIEANYVTIDSGSINVVSSDDGININGGNDESGFDRPGNTNTKSDDDEDVLLTINGGKIVVNADGDGLDSNGSIIINGGIIYVDGPTNDGNGALDYNNKFTMNDGTLIAIGSSGMAQNISDGSKANGVLMNLDNTYQAGTTIEFGDITYTSKKTFNSIMIATSSIKTGNNYILKLNNDEVANITITDTVTNYGNSSRNMMGGGRRRGNR